MSNPGDGDKRSTHTDALETLGFVIGPNEKRDAIHLAVEPTVAKDHLIPGSHVSVDGRWVQPGDKAAVGIVDPFLAKPVEPGERFWLVVYPRQIHSLRHVWTHPAFADAPEVAGEAPKLHKKFPFTADESEAWLRDFAKHNDCPDYDMLIAAASDESVESDDGYTCAYKDGEYLHFGGIDAHGAIPPEFWSHVENVTGKKITDRPEYFSCSC